MRINLIIVMTALLTAFILSIVMYDIHKAPIHKAIDNFIETNIKKYQQETVVMTIQALEDKGYLYVPTQTNPEPKEKTKEPSSKYFNDNIPTEKYLDEISANQSSDCRYQLQTTRKELASLSAHKELTGDVDSWASAGVKVGISNIAAECTMDDRVFEITDTMASEFRKIAGYE